MRTLSAGATFLCLWTGATNWREYKENNARADVGHYKERVAQVVEIGMVMVAGADITIFSETGDTMTLLIPDRDRENRDDFVWCLPIDRQKWNKWIGLAKKFKGVTPPEHGAVHYVNRMEGKQVRTVLLMPTEMHDDDTVVAAAAYLRMVKQLSCRMYVVRCSDQRPSMATLIAATAGADPKQVEDVELDDETEDQPNTP